MPGDHTVTSLEGLDHFHAFEALGRKQIQDLNSADQALIDQASAYDLHFAEVAAFIAGNKGMVANIGLIAIAREAYEPFIPGDFNYDVLWGRANQALANLNGDPRPPRMPFSQSIFVSGQQG